MGHLLLLLVSVAGDGPSIPSSSVSVSASWLSRGLFELRYADGGCPSFNDALTARNTEQILLILNKYTDLACFCFLFLQQRYLQRAKICSFTNSFDNKAYLCAKFTQQKFIEQAV